MSAIKMQIFRNGNTCEKCASEMHDRKLFMKNLRTFIKIKQCFVCRHWFETNN